MAKQVIPGVYTFTGLFAGRVYLIEGADGLTVIDAGLSLAAPKIVKQIEALGHRASDVKRILVTHAHPDHVGGLPELARLTGAEVIASAIEKPFVEGTLPIERADPDKLSGMARRMYRPGDKVPGTPVDRTVGDEDELPDGLVVVATPGHAPGHVAFWQPERRLLFCGDVMMNFTRLVLPFAAFTPDMDENRRSAARVAELEPAIVCFGHGPPLTQGAAEAIRDFARKVRRGDK